MALVESKNTRYIPEEYRKIVKDPQAREQALEYAINTYTPQWDNSLGRFAEEQSAKFRERTSAYIQQYEDNIQKCDPKKGGECCEIALHTEGIIALSIFDADNLRAHNNQPLIVEAIKQSPTQLDEQGIIFTSTNAD